MMGARLASIIVNNYNYGRFLAEAIESALGQTYTNVEVIVVDDGSTDESRALIARYADAVVPVLKDNGGQASALNAGFSASRGEVILFLDADDTLLPDALSTAVPLLSDPSTVNVHWPLHVIDEAGRPTGGVEPSRQLSEGDCRELVRREGPASLTSAPTSGNAWARSFLDRVLPIPEREHRVLADAYLFGLAPALGVVKRSSRPLGCYRIHGTNNFRGKSIEERIKVGCRAEEEQWRALHGYYRSVGAQADPARWRARSWFHRLRAASAEISALIPPNSTVILLDEGRWAAEELGDDRRCIPFPERDGQYSGRPENDDQAVAEVERLRRRGAQFVVVAWSAFWWLQHYAGLHQHLSQFRCLRESEHVVVFDVRGTVEPKGGQ